MSARRMLALVAGLPPDAAVNRDGKQWTDDREFAARMVERIDYWGAKTTELLVRSLGWKQGEVRKYLAALDDPVRFTHPQRGDGKPKSNVVTDLREVARFFARN